MRRREKLCEFTACITPFVLVACGLFLASMGFYHAVWTMVEAGVPNETINEVVGDIVVLMLGAGLAYTFMEPAAKILKHLVKVRRCGPDNLVSCKERGPAGA